MYTAEAPASALVFDPKKSDWIGMSMLARGGLKTIALAMLVFGLGLAQAADEPQKKPQMKFMGAFDAGQPGVSIYKLFDPTEDVVCYALMPETAGRRQIEGGKWVYEGNTVGSISCLKVKLPVIPVSASGSGK